MLAPLPRVIAIISETNKSDGFAHTGDADMAAWAESAAARDAKLQCVDVAYPEALEALAKELTAAYSVANE
ncbi:hypothetical protein HFO49_22560 [Rhizobium leguminosarum]|nr:hypothetical protein [Rhizobium leguminosarum]MBY5600621.1 hypothetical protein [Rhizobium leguminosarum]MBY5697713.1 hypothetical protein [Rhizobium leguminosarum]